MRPVAVGNQGVARRQGTRLPDADPHARDKQMPIALRKSAEHRHRAPCHHGNRNHVAAVEAAGGKRERKTERREEQREGDAGKQPELNVAQSKLAPNRRERDREHLPVEMRQSEIDSQNE